VSDVDKARLDLCEELGFETVNMSDVNLVGYINDSPNGEGIDIVFACSDAEAAAIEMTQLARVGGTICMTGIHKAPRPVDLREINFQEQTLVGSRVTIKHAFEMSVALATTLADDLETVMTQTVPLSEAEGLFNRIANPSVSTVKVLVDCEA